jgi:hypothetical protein
MVENNFRQIFRENAETKNSVFALPFYTVSIGKLHSMLGISILLTEPYTLKSYTDYTDIDVHTISTNANVQPRLAYQVVHRRLVKFNIHKTISSYDPMKQLSVLYNSKFSHHFLLILVLFIFFNIELLKLWYGRQTDVHELMTRSDPNIRKKIAHKLETKSG